MFQREQAVASMIEGRDLDWATAVATAEPADCTPVKATDPLYILYTSGTPVSLKALCVIMVAMRSLLNTV